MGIGAGEGRDWRKGVAEGGKVEGGAQGEMGMGLEESRRGGWREEWRD